MPTLNPLPPTLPQAPPVPPMAPHHLPPGNVLPKPVPVPTPTVSPQPQPSPFSVVIAIGTVIQATACPVGVAMKMRKPRQSSDRPPKRRQSPCHGQTPKVEYRERRRQIGRFWVPKLASRTIHAASGGGVDNAIVENRTRLVAYRAGYRRLFGNPVRIVSELDKPRLQ